MLGLYSTLLPAIVFASQPNVKLVSFGAKMTALVYACDKLAQTTFISDLMLKIHQNVVVSVFHICVKSTMYGRS